MVPENLIPKSWSLIFQEEQVGVGGGRGLEAQVKSVLKGKSTESLF